MTYPRVISVTVGLLLSVGSGSAAAQAPAAISPPKVIRGSEPVYPPDLLRQRASAEVELQITISEDGAVSQQTVIRSTDHRFEAAAIAAAANLRFQPATQDGKPVAVSISYTYRFEPPALPTVGTLTGLVIEKGTRRKLAGVRIQLDDEHFADSGDDGAFRLEVPSGPHPLTVFRSGYVTQQLSEDVRAGETVTLKILLEPIRANNYETVIRDNRNVVELSRVELNRQEAVEVPGTLGGDPIRVTTDLPGVAPARAGLAIPSVRGFSPGDIDYRIDGIHVPTLFHFVFGPGVLNPDFVESMNFFLGIAPLQYGRALAGTIDISLAEPRDDLIRAVASADLLFASGLVTVPLPTGTTISLAGRFSYTGWLLTTVQQGSADQFGLQFSDYQARIEQKLGPGKLRLLAFGSRDGVISTQNNVPQQDTHLSFDRADLRYQWRAGAVDGQLGATVGIDRLSDFNQTPSQYLYEGTGFERTAQGYLRLRLRAGSNLTILTGADVERRSATVRTTRITSSGEESDTQNLATALLSGAYAEFAWTSGAWTVSGGLRGDEYHLVPGIDYLRFSPRASVLFQVTDAVLLKAAAAVVNAPPTSLLQFPGASITALQLGTQNAFHLETGVEWQIDPHLQLSASAYYSGLTRTVDLSQQASPDSSPFEYASPSRFATAVSTGAIYGADIMLRHRIGENWFGWVSYSLMSSLRNTTYPLYSDTGQIVGTGQELLPYPLDRTHTLNAVVAYKLPRSWTLGLSAHLTSGLVESGSPDSYTMRVGHDANGNPAWVPVDQPQLNRLPFFFSADIRVSKIWTYDAFTLELSLDFGNATLSPSVRGYQYTTTTGPSGEIELQKTPLVDLLPLPIIGIKARF